MYSGITFRLDGANLMKCMLPRCIFFAAFLFFITSSEAATQNNFPVEKKGFTVNVAALYLLPSADNLAYATYTQPLPLPAPHWKTNNVDPTFQAAFDLGVQYTFASAADQISVSYLHLDTSNSNSVSATGSASVAPPYYFGPLAQELFHSSAKGTAQFDIENPTVVYSHLFNLKYNIRLTPLLGISTAYLKEYLESNYQGDNAAIAGDHYNITSYNTSKYIGAGPHFGLNLADYLYHHFSIFANTGFSIMAGLMKSETNFRSEGRDNTAPAYTSLANQEVVRMVTELNSKLGMTYSFSFHSSRLALQLGYMFSVYFNGINQVVPTSLVAGQLNNGVIAIETYGQEQSNLDLNGPYLNLVWQF